MLSIVDGQRFCESPCSEVGGYGYFFKGKKAFFHLFLHKLKPLKSPCLVIHTQVHSDGSIRGTAGLGRLEVCENKEF